MNALAMILSKGSVALTKDARRAASGHYSALVARGTTRLSFALSVHDTHGGHEDTSHKWLSASRSKPNPMKQGATSWKH